MSEPTIRLDKWLWFARFRKSRSLAAEFCAEGRIRVNRNPVNKAAATVKIGDVVTLPLGPEIRVVRVLALGLRRGPPAEARLLYEEVAGVDSAVAKCESRRPCRSLLDRVDGDRCASAGSNRSCEKMTYVVTESCIKCKYTDCVEVCPVDCFYEGENMLVINPDECIDCGVCEPECPAEAILPDTDSSAAKWAELNRDFGTNKWPNITRKKDAPADADEFKGVDGKFDKFFSDKPGSGT